MSGSRIVSAGARLMRTGVTLMETVFAIGVILTGLLGLAALIPIASNNAQSAMELDRSISESTAAAAISSVQQFNDLDRLVIYYKPVSTSAGPTGETLTGQVLSIRDALTVGGSPNKNKLSSPGYGHSNDQAGLQAGICIDPLGMPDIRTLLAGPSTPTNGNYADDTSGAPFAAPVGTDSAYDHSRFPYYNERYKVLLPPNEAVTASDGPVASGPVPPNPPQMPFPMSPRMWRATLRSDMYANSAPVFRHQIISRSYADRVFSGSGGLTTSKGFDNSDPASVLLTKTVVTSGVAIDSSTANSSEYSWFATLVPPFLGGNSFRQSIVVVKQRLPEVPRRIDDPLALQKRSYAIDDADENPRSERLAWVGNWIGFVGGAGGEVELYGSASVSSDIRTGEWVMLSRQPHRIGGGPLTLGMSAYGPAVHRWYRVLRVDDPQYGFINAGGFGAGWNDSDTNTNPEVWRRTVTLAGPDWAFQDETGSNTTHIDDTYCTIVSGAVSVVESEVVIE
ncbi:hypothetical protein LOC71_19265 [Rhodopirellula sp. JC740]|uniref:Uncharacterized protein n=1 Tax=Rhodopirellula halodulae TaxID=2894198 RepID=A0ABS8NLH9_9BACT|nr:hypothetical protein [Rhodopirellula sp. JC740]MCC9644418.1 hypothetical protein [Rhodopirellula sp. JC740]